MVNAAWGLRNPPPHPYHKKISQFKPVIESDALNHVREVMGRRGLRGILELTERFENIDRHHEGVGERACPARSL